MSDTTLDLLHKRLEDLRIDSVMIRGRIEELVQTIEMLERRRGGRPRKPAEVSVIPKRQATDTTNGPVGVAGAMFETPTEESAA